VLRSNQLALIDAFQKAIICHQQGRLLEAERYYELVVKVDDRHFPAVHGLGLIRLQQGRHADAATMFRRAVTINGNSAEAHHHLAVALTELGRPEEAIPEFERALAINANFAEAHDSLGHALQVLDRVSEAITHHEKALAIKPRYAAARNNLGNALRKIGRFEQAVAQYQQALAINPGYALARTNLARALAALRFDANQPAGVGVPLVRRDAGLFVTLGDIYLEIHETELACNAFHAAEAIDPSLIAAGFGLARAASILDNIEEAAARFKGYVERGIGGVAALIGLANLPISMPGIDLIAALQDAGAKVTAKEEQIRLAFALASALDKAGRHAEAWQKLVIANQAMFAEMKSELGKEAELQRSSLELLRAQSAGSARDGNGSGSGESGARRSPISLLVIGPSRSGKSTIEKLVGTLRRVKRGGENPSPEKALQRTLQAAGLPTEGVLKDLPAPLYSNFHETYLEELARRAGSAEVFTNTYPGAVHRAALITAACPNVRLLLVKRNLEDSLLRIYMKYYGHSNPYAYDIEAAKSYVLWYQEMIDLLAEKFPTIARVVHYEDMIADPAGALRTVAELCGLPIPEGAVPAPGDDRGCAQPYRAFMTAVLRSDCIRC
jgi:tetratricopeptide (TPR) repeat protein